MFLVFDIGGTNMRLAVSEDGTTISEPVVCKTNPNSFEDSMQSFTDAARSLVGDTQVQGIAGGIPGPMNDDKSVIITAPNMPDWQGKPIKEYLSSTFNAPVFLENDTVVIGMGEATAGAGKGEDIVVYMTVSTGVGGARIENGMPSKNALGFEPGHQVIDINGPTCGCGGTGHLEAFISGANIKRQLGVDGEHIQDEAVWDKAAYHLALGLNNVMVFWSPDTIVLGGSVMKSIDIEKVRAYAQEVVHIYPTIPPIQKAALGESGGLIGSLAYLTKQL